MYNIIYIAYIIQVSLQTKEVITVPRMLYDLTYRIILKYDLLRLTLVHVFLYKQICFT